MRNVISCEQEKKKFLEVYACYDWVATDSLAEVIAITPTSDFPNYDETPEKAVIFAMTGTDGCHYCMVENGEKMNVYIVYPNMGYDNSAYLIGHSISEMLSYSLAIQGLFEYAFELEKDDFLKKVEDMRPELMMKYNSNRFKNDLLALKKVYPITEVSVSEVYDRLRTMNYIEWA